MSTELNSRVNTNRIYSKNEIVLPHVLLAQLIDPGSFLRSIQHKINRQGLEHDCTGAF